MIVYELRFNEVSIYIYIYEKPFCKKSPSVILSEMAGTTTALPPRATEDLRDKYSREMPHTEGIAAHGIRPVVPAPAVMVGNEFDLASMQFSTTSPGGSPNMDMSSRYPDVSPKKFSEMCKSSSFVKDLLEPSSQGGATALKVTSLTNELTCSHVCLMMVRYMDSPPSHFCHRPHCRCTPQSSCGCP